MVVQHKTSPVEPGTTSPVWPGTTSSVGPGVPDWSGSVAGLIRSQAQQGLPDWPTYYKYAIGKPAENHMRIQSIEYYLNWNPV